MIKFIIKAIIIVLGLLILIPLGSLLFWIIRMIFSGISFDSPMWGPIIAIVGIIVIICSIISLFKD